MKNLKKIVFLLLAAALLVSCSSTSSYSNFADIPGYLTKSQKAMLRNLKQLDSDGFLYELDYTEDYHLDDVISLCDIDREAVYSKVRQLLSPKSRYPFEKLCVPGACSAFRTENDKGQSIVGRNYDWFNVESAPIVVKCSPEGGYKSVGMADMSFSGILRANLFSAKGQDFLLDAPLATTDGVNEKGFCASVLILEDTYEMNADTARPDLSAFYVIRYLLDNADSVDTAIGLLNKFDIYSPYDGVCFHWILADASGKAAAVEIVDGKLSVIRPKTEGGNLSLTNYYLTSGVDSFKEGVWRKKIMDYELSLCKNPTDEQAMDILKSVRFTNDFDEIMNYRKNGKDPADLANWKWITLWSLVYNLDDLSVDIAVRENYKNIYTVTL